jgi:hypothetical protein
MLQSLKIGMFQQALEIAETDCGECSLLAPYLDKRYGENIAVINPATK